MKTLTNAQVERETAKAALVAIETAKGIKKVWFPKSQIKISEAGVQASEWILKQKADELGLQAAFLIGTSDDSPEEVQSQVDSFKSVNEKIKELVAAQKKELQGVRDYDKIERIKDKYRELCHQVS